MIIPILILLSTASIWVELHFHSFLRKLSFNCLYPAQDTKRILFNQLTNLPEPYCHPHSSYSQIVYILLSLCTLIHITSEQRPRRRIDWI